MGKENGFEFTPKEGGIGMHEQNTNPYEPFATGAPRKTASQAKLFKNGSNKSEGAGTVNGNSAYGPVTFGAP